MGWPLASLYAQDRPSSRPHRRPLESLVPKRGCWRQAGAATQSAGKPEAAGVELAAGTAEAELALASFLTAQLLPFSHFQVWPVESTVESPAALAVQAGAASQAGFAVCGVGNQHQSTVKERVATAQRMEHRPQQRRPLLNQIQDSRR
jgi:hypothetical protein